MKIWFPQLNFLHFAIWREIEFLNFFRVMNFEYFYKLWNVAFYVEKISLVRQFYHSQNFSKWIDMANKWREINIFRLLIEYEIRFFTIIPHVNTRSALIFSFDRI